MTVLIIEDEILARDYLIGLLNQLSMDFRIEDDVNSVKEAIKWFLKNEEPDLIFMDIDLGDGLCFEIFDVIDLRCPVIFTTAYDEYAIKAFKVNSIDYLLKPISLKELEQSISKYKTLKEYRVPDIDYKDLGHNLGARYKERFIIKVGTHLKTVPITDIFFFNSENKSSYVTTTDGRKYPLDYSLDKLDGLLDPADFFRINRKYFISYRAIIDMVSFSNSRLKVTLKNCKDQDIVVSRDRVQAFKQWLDK